jgi:hypothetical protein
MIRRDLEAAREKWIEEAKTLGVYTHVGVHDQVAAIEAMPGPPWGVKKGDQGDPRLGLVGQDGGRGTTLARVAKLSPLAISLRRLVSRRRGDRPRETAPLGHVTRRRLPQIMSLLNLAPGIERRFCSWLMGRA